MRFIISCCTAYAVVDGFTTTFYSSRATRLHYKNFQTLFHTTLSTTAHEEETNEINSQFWEKIRSPSFDIQTLPSSISHLVSTPQRYATALNMTIDEVNQYKKEYHTSIQEYKQNLLKKYQFEDRSLDDNDENIPGHIRHKIHCEVKYKFGRDPFVCQTCWTHQPICICERSKACKKIHKIDSIEKVIIWTHHDEWGKTSNTGSVIKLMLKDWCELWMKGLEEHDRLLNDLLTHDVDDEKNEVIPIILWPQLNKENDQNHQWTSIDELNQKVEVMKKEGKKERKVVIIAIEGTWRNARRMIKKLPPNIKRLDVGEFFSDLSILDGNNGTANSILQPLRSQGTGASKSSVCTAEAILAALIQFGLPHDEAKQVLETVKDKVHMTVQFQGKKG